MNDGLFNLTRRMFLGTVASAAAGTVILEASPSDIAHYAQPGLSVAVAEPDLPPSTPHGGDVGMFVYNHRGEILGVISDIAMDFERDMVETTTFDSTTQRMVPRLNRGYGIRYTVIGQGEVQARVALSTAHRMPRKF